MLFNTIEKEIQDIITAIMLKKSRSIKIVFKTSTSFNTRKKSIYTLYSILIYRKKKVYDDVIKKNKQALSLLIFYALTSSLANDSEERE